MEMVPGLSGHGKIAPIHGKILPDHIADVTETSDGDFTANTETKADTKKAEESSEDTSGIDKKWVLQFRWRLPVRFAASHHARSEVCLTAQTVLIWSHSSLPFVLLLYTNVARK